MHFNETKMLEKLKMLIKTCDTTIYEWMFYSKHDADQYLYQEIYNAIKKVVKDIYNENCSIYNLGSRAMGIAEKDSSDLDIFIDIGKTFMIISSIK